MFRAVPFMATIIGMQYIGTSWSVFWRLTGDCFICWNANRQTPSTDTADTRTVVPIVRLLLYWQAFSTWRLAD